MAYGMRLLARVGIVGAGRHDPLPPDGAWLRDYDPEAHDGQGDVTWTTDPALAQRFDTQADVLDCWSTVPKVRPKRADGKPNRPLTSYTITPEPLPKETLR
jgi:hypothetical protein